MRRGTAAIPLCVTLAVALTALAQERVTLRLVDWADLDEMPVDKAAIAEFEKLHPTVDVLYEPNPGRQYEEKILTGLAADAPPDVFLLDSKLIPSFTNKRVLLDLTPFIRLQKVDTAQWFPGMLSIARRGSSVFAFPKGFTPLMVYFNKGLFDEARVAYPTQEWTWNDYLDAARKLTRDIDGDGIPDRYGTAFTNYYFYWIPWIWSAGGDVLSPDGTRATGFLNSPNTERALRFLIDLRLTEHVAPDVGSWIQAEKTGTNYALFAEGKIALLVDGHWRLQKFTKYIEDGTLRIGVAPFPRSENGMKVNVLYESGWCVPVNTKHPEESALLAAFMAGETSCRIRSAGKLEIPANRKVGGETAAGDQTGMEQMFIQEVPHCRQPWGSIIERFSEIEWTLQDAVDEVMINGKPMHQVMTAYAGRIDQQLEEIRSHERYEFRPIKEHSEILSFLGWVSAAAGAAALLCYVRAKRKARPALATAFGFLFPSLLHLVVFVCTPIAFAAYLSLHRWDIVVADQPFVGLANFRAMAADPGFWNALKNTIVYSLNVPLGMAVSLAVALLLNNRLKGTRLLRTVYFLPSVTSFVAISLVWMWIYHPSFGVANLLLSFIGVAPLQWLNSSQTAMIAMVVFSIWLGIGYQMIIFLAGLQGIPPELYESARIDGASRSQRFIHITLPLLKPATFFILVTSLIASFQVFTCVYMMTAGGPVGSTDVLVYHIYRAAWEELRMGYASAMSWVLFVIILIATWVQFKVIGREVEYT